MQNLPENGREALESWLSPQRLRKNPVPALLLQAAGIIAWNYDSCVSNLSTARRASSRSPVPLDLSLMMAMGLRPVTANRHVTPSPALILGSIDPEPAAISAGALAKPGDIV
jgi:hypothetical protein